jgi:hypothetical protein
VLGNDYPLPRNAFARFTTSRSDLAIGSLATAPQDAASAIEPRRCHLPRNASAKNMGVRSCGAGGGPGIAVRVACSASKFHWQGNGSVASTTSPFSPVPGLEAATRLAAGSVLTVVLAMPQPKSDVGHGDGCDLSRARVKSRSGSVVSPQSNRCRGLLQAALLTFQQNRICSDGNGTGNGRQGVHSSTQIDPIPTELRCHGVRCISADDRV